MDRIAKGALDEDELSPRLCRATADRQLLAYVKTLAKDGNQRAADITAVCGDGRVLIHAARSYGCRGTGVFIPSAHVAGVARDLLREASPV